METTHGTLIMWMVACKQCALSKLIHSLLLFSVIRLSCHCRTLFFLIITPAIQEQRCFARFLLLEDRIECLLLGWGGWYRQLPLSSFFFAIAVGDSHSEELYCSPLLINMRKLMYGKMGLDDSLTLSHLENQTQICQGSMLWICWWNISHTEHITTLVKMLYTFQVILSSNPHWSASKSSIIRLQPHHKDNMEQMIWHVS